MPCSSMRNGYSFVPWVDPRYLTMRRRRVEISSRMRWSSTITQSETNSSMPCRVSLSGRSRSAVMTVVSPLLLEPAEQAADFGAQDARVRQLAEERFDRVQDDALRPDPLDRVGNANEEAVEVVLAGFRNLAARDVHVVQEQLLVRHQPVQVETERRGVLGQVRDRFLERHEHAGFVVLGGAPNQELQSEQRLSGTGAAADQRGTPAWATLPR